MIEILSNGQTFNRGVWLDCRHCQVSGRIAGSNHLSSYWRTASDNECAEQFRLYGWAGDGDRMLNARCRECHEKEFAQK